MTRARGFSMVELMVAMTLALIVTSGIMAVFLGARSAYQSTSGTAAVADGGRFALDFIQNSVRGAGYMACNTAARTPTTINLTAADTLYANYGEGLGGFEAGNTGPGNTYSLAVPTVAPDGVAGDWIGGLDSLLVGQVVKNNDVLVVRSTTAGAPTSYVTSIADGVSTFVVNVVGGLATNKMAVISDCYKSVAFQITNVPASGTNATVTHGVGGSPGNSTSSFGNLSFAPGAQVTPVDTVIYYIGKGADGDSALFAATWLAGTNTLDTTKELVPDIEAMQVLYGVDTNSTQTVSQYVTANQVTEFNNVMSVKVAILAASSAGMAQSTGAQTYTLLGTTVTAPADSRARHVFEITIGVRNALP